MHLNKYFCSGNGITSDNASKIGGFWNCIEKGGGSPSCFISRRVMILSPVHIIMMKNCKMETNEMI
ncbi:hypothetical protein [Clostridium pasteurianum]|uniref:hypothetical protein n=1 Tax=Clostridium pasteurianum TaxID=1501 RepID=UPI0015865B24|nr:hypothetical protein [Clostridium pasteurianum]